MAGPLWGAALALLILAPAAAQRIESWDATPRTVLHTALDTGLRGWLTAPETRAAAVARTIGAFEALAGPGPHGFQREALAGALNDFAAIQGNMGANSQEHPEETLAVLLALATLERADAAARQRLRQQLRTIAAEVELHFWQRTRQSRENNAPVRRSELSQLIEARLESHVFPFVRDPLWPMLKYPLSPEEYDRTRRRLLGRLDRIVTDRPGPVARETMLREAAELVRGIPEAAALARLRAVEGFEVGGGEGPPRVYLAFGLPDDPETLRAWFAEAARASGMPRAALAAWEEQRRAQDGPRPQVD